MLEELLGQLRERADGEMIDVVSDALLEAQDPRGDLIAAQRAGIDPSEPFAACVERVRQLVPGARSITIGIGFVTRIEVSLGDAPRISERFFATEPLARVALALPEKAGKAETAAAAASLRRGRGIELTQSFDDKTFTRVRGFLEAAEPRVLAFNAYVEERRLDRDWPWLRSLSIQCADDIAAAFIARSPQLSRLKLHVAEPNAAIRAALDIESLSSLDVRGCKLSADSLAALETWPGEVIHESRGLQSPGGLEDPFVPGLRWDSLPAPSRRLVALRGPELDFAATRDREVRLHRNDNPTFKGEVDSAVTALAGGDGELVLGGADGLLRRWSASSHDVVEVVAELGGEVLSVSTNGDDLAAVFDGGWWCRIGGLVSSGARAPAALALFGGGLVRARGSMVEIGGERIVELRDPVCAVVGDGDDVIALAGAHVWRVRGDELVAIGAREEGAPPAVAARDGVVAWASSPTSISIWRQGVLDAAYYSSYSGQSDPLRVADVAVAADETAIVAFEEGGMNILLPGGRALKADPFPGDRRVGWVFIYGGKILMADP